MIFSSVREDARNSQPLPLTIAFQRFRFTWLPLKVTDWPVWNRFRTNLQVGCTLPIQEPQPRQGLRESSNSSPSLDSSGRKCGGRTCPWERPRKMGAELARVIDLT